MYDSVELSCTKRKDLKQNFSIQTEVCVCVFLYVYGGAVLRGPNSSVTLLIKSV